MVNETYSRGLHTPVPGRKRAVLLCIFSECNMGSEGGQGTAGAGSWLGITSLDTVLFSSGVTRSIGSMTVFFNTSTASCARPVSPVANDFIGIYVTSGSSIDPFTENIAVATPLRSPAISFPNKGMVLRNCEYDPNGLTAHTIST